ncbi:GH32 C-terminal domain-containing protein, partial [Corynebacterium accolens]
PRIVRLRDEVDEEIYDVLFVTLERDGRDVSGYLVGQLEDTTFTVVSGFRRVDFGHDFSRPRNTNATAGTIPEESRYERAVILGLLNGNGRGDDATQHASWDAEGWSNALSLPRQVTLEGGVLYQAPATGLPEAVKLSDYARSWTGVMEVPTGSSVTITLRDGNGDPAASICHSGEEISLDRSMNKAFDHFFADSAPATATLADGDSDTLTIIQDGSTVEVFVDGGLIAMASRVYFDGGCSGMDV